MNDNLLTKNKYNHGKVLINSNEIRKAIKNIQPNKIAVAYIGNDFEKLINLGKVKQIVISPTLGSNPYAIEKLVNMLGWEKVYFLDNLHAKIYIGKDAAVLTSANLSRNGLSGEGLIEIGTFISDKIELQRINDVFRNIINKSDQLYKNESLKKEKLLSSKETFQKDPYELVISDINATIRPPIAQKNIKIDKIEELPKLIKELSNNFKNDIFSIEITKDPLFKINFFSRYFTPEEEKKIAKEVVIKLENVKYSEITDKSDYFEFTGSMDNNYMNFKEGDWILLCKINEHNRVETVNDIMWFLVTHIIKLNASENKFIALDLRTLFKKNIQPPYEIKHLRKDIILNTINHDDYKKFIIWNETKYTSKRILEIHEKLRDKIISLLHKNS